MTNKILIDEAVVRQGAVAIASYFAAANRDEEMEAEDALLEFRSSLRQALSDSVEQPRSEAALAPAKVFGFEIVVDKTMPPDELRLVRSPPAPAPVPEAHKPLTDEQIQKLRHNIDWTASWSYIDFARAIEAAHGIGEKK